MRAYGTTVVVTAEAEFRRYIPLGILVGEAFDSCLAHSILIIRVESAAGESVCRGNVSLLRTVHAQEG